MTRRFVAAVALVVTLAAGCGATATDDLALPVTELEGVNGASLDLQETGRARVLNLWATWCTPCRAELPAFDAVAANTTAVDIIGINTGESADDAAELIEELGLGFRQVVDPRASVQSSLRITGMPATIFVAADGELLEIHSGELDQAELENLIADHFG